MPASDVAHLLQREKEAACEAVRAGRRNPGEQSLVRFDGKVIARVVVDMARDVMLKFMPHPELEYAPIGFVHLTPAGTALLALPWSPDA